jgi:hypothetical protein
MASWHVDEPRSYERRRRERNAWLALGAFAALTLTLWALRELVG